jgi:hypothetical protein
VYKIEIKEGEVDLTQMTPSISCPQSSPIFGLYLNYQYWGIFPAIAFWTNSTPSVRVTYRTAQGSIKLRERGTRIWASTVTRPAKNEWSRICVENSTECIVVTMRQGRYCAQHSPPVCHEADPFWGKGKRQGDQILLELHLPPSQPKLPILAVPNQTIPYPPT